MPIQGFKSKIFGSLQWCQSALMTSPNDKRRYKSHICLYMWILLVVMKMGRSTRLQDPIMISSWEKKQRTCCHSAQILGLLCLCSYYFGEFQHGPYGIIFDPAHFHSKIWFRVLVVGHFQAFLGVHPRSLSHNEGGSKGRLYEHKGMI